MRCDGLFFGYIRDVANVSKHQRINRPNALIRTVEDINESIILIRHQDNKGYYYSTRSTVTLEALDGSRLLIEAFILLTVLSFSNILINVNAIPKLPRDGIKRRNFGYSRHEIENLPKIIMGGNVGEELRLTLGSYIYDPSPVFELRGAQPKDEFNGTSSSMDLKIDTGFFE